VDLVTGSDLGRHYVADDPECARTEGFDDVEDSDA
jgi:hypothetical protein